MWNNKPLILLLFLITILLSLSTINAVDNITVDSDSVVDNDLEIPTEKLEIKFKDNDKKFTLNVVNKRDCGVESYDYTYTVNNKSKVISSGTIVNMEKELSYYEDGTHELIIKNHNYYDKRLLFNVTFNILNNISQSQDINIQNTKTIHYHIENGIITTGLSKNKMGDGEHLYCEFLLTGSGDTKIDILKINYRGYIVNGVDIRPKTRLTIMGSTLCISSYDNYKSYLYNPKVVKINEQTSWDGLYDYQYKKKIIKKVKVKKPVYGYKKVKKYKWKYYKTRWFTKKIVTHRIRNGKLITYHTAYDKIDKLKNKNAKIIKTVTSKDKTTVYLKQPIKYYKKVKKYKKKRYIKRYKKVTKNEVSYSWVNARDTAEVISSF